MQLTRMLSPVGADSHAFDPVAMNALRMTAVRSSCSPHPWAAVSRPVGTEGKYVRCRVEPADATGYSIGPRLPREHDN